MEDLVRITSCENASSKMGDLGSASQSGRLFNIAGLVSMATRNFKDIRNEPVLPETLHVTDK